MSEKKFSPKFTALEDLDHPFKTGNLIVGNTLYVFDNRQMTDSYDLNGRNIPDKVADARRQADLSNRAKIVVDTYGEYNEDVINDFGKLLTSNEAFEHLSEEEQDGLNDLSEYFANH